jgi:hypothetical protein
VLLSILASGNYRWQENSSHPFRGWLLIPSSCCNHGPTLWLGRIGFLPGGEISTAMIWLIFLNWMLFLLVVAFMEAEQFEGSGKTGPQSITRLYLQQLPPAGIHREAEM